MYSLPLRGAVNTPAACTYLHLQVLNARPTRTMVELSREHAKLRIHGANLRATAPRVAVLRLLSSANKPLSHSEVVSTIGSDDWDQATLYRNLLKLVGANLARIASKVDGVARYELRGEHDEPHFHPHFSCRSCGTVECLPNTTVSGPITREWASSIGGAELQLIGNCPSCLSDERKPDSNDSLPVKKSQARTSKLKNKSPR